MSTITEAEGLLDWHRLQELEAMEYLDEDESWERHVLRDKYDCHPPPPPIYADRPFTYEEYRHFERKHFMAKVWADEIVRGFKANLILGNLINVERD